MSDNNMQPEVTCTVRAYIHAYCCASTDSMLLPPESVSVNLLRSVRVILLQVRYYRNDIRITYYIYYVHVYN